MKLCKVEWPLFAAFIIGFAAFACALAVPLSQAFAYDFQSGYQRWDTAQRAAMEACREIDRDLSSFSWVQSGSFTVVAVDGGFKLSAPSHNFTCTPDPVAPGGTDPVATPNYTSVLIEWSAPTTRADGSALAPSEIKSYTIYQEIDDVFKPVGTTSALSYTVQGLAKGDYVFALTTTDINGLESVLSKPVAVTLK